MVAFARVALNLPVAGEFTYLVPERLARELEPGCRVRVPFHGRRMAGIVVSLDRETDVAPNRLKEIDSRIAGIPALPPGLVEFTRELARAYACSWGTALEAALPGTLKRGPSRTLPAVELALDEGRIREACLELEDRAPKRARVLRVLLELGSPLQLGVLLRRTGLSRSPVATLVKSGHLRWTRVEMQDDLFRNLRLEVAPRHELVPAQRQAVESVVRCLHSGRHETFLLHGVTGSGKTEVYLRVLEELRSLGRSAIILVPEISLTPQTVGRFLSRFPDVAVLHSSLTDATRARQWLRIARGEAKVVAGARSALFAPCRELGLIIVDEEHESSFKQQQSPRYHAREMAVLRGRIENAAVVLGSATPSLEAWSRSRSGEYTLLRLPERVGGGSLPRVQIVDMRHEAPVRGKPPLISRRLEILMQEKARAGEQFMLFLNRRGYSPVLFCPACGETIKCAACEIPMTWHAQSGRLICHYCMADRRRPELCPGCEASAPIALGAGTERIEHWIKRSFPELVVARMDSDTMVKRDSYEKVLTAFRRRDIDVLVGTQRIAKGHDFPD
ncbi:MAG: primosomal protein N', partial [Planctomycetota bacterium]